MTGWRDGTAAIERPLRRPQPGRPWLVGVRVNRPVAQLEERHLIVH